MALRSLTRSFQRNAGCVNALAQTRSIVLPVASLADHRSLSALSSEQRHAIDFLRTQNARSISWTGSLSSSERESSSSSSVAVQPDADVSSLDSSSSANSAAASLIQARVEEAVATLPLTERLFAVVQIDGHQYRVSQDDVITVEDWLPAEMGERVRLEKVLLVGGRDFSFIGRPLLRRSQVCVEATVIEKSLTATDIIRRFRQRSRFKKTWLTRKPITYLRINAIKLLSPE